MKLKKRWIFLGSIVLLCALLSIPEILHTNEGESISEGSVRSGKLRNGWLMPFEGDNFHYFSRFSYYILNNAYVNSRVYKTLMDAYETCETTCPGKEFILMECTRKKGGWMVFHWTHQNGTSVDFMVPTIRTDHKQTWTTRWGLLHYLLQFNQHGQLAINHKTQIDFETMARHILALDDAARQNGLRIYKVLFNTNMQDELFDTPSGKKLQQRDIRIIPRVSDLVNMFHDDHYHVDFEIE